MNMIDHIAIQPGYALSGLLVGLAIGLTGVGGGSLMTPILVLLFRFHPSTAVGTDLLFAAVTKTVGTSIHHAGKTVDWQIVRRLAAGSVPAALLCLLALGHFGVESKAVTATVTTVLGAGLLLSAIALLFKNRIVSFILRRYPEFGASRSPGLTVATGFILGVLVSLSSVGAGALGTVALLILYPRLPVVRIVGSDIAHAVPLALLAGLGHWYLGAINFPLLGALLAGSIPGIVLGSYGARYAPDAVLRTLLGAILFLVGLKMLGNL